MNKEIVLSSQKKTNIDNTGTNAIGTILTRVIFHLAQSTVPKMLPRLIVSGQMLPGLLFKGLRLACSEQDMHCTNNIRTYVTRTIVMRTNLSRVRARLALLMSIKDRKFMKT